MQGWKEVNKLKTDMEELQRKYLPAEDRWLSWPFRYDNVLKQKEKAELRIEKLEVCFLTLLLG